MEVVKNMISEHLAVNQTALPLSYFLERPDTNALNDVWTYGLQKYTHFALLVGVSFFLHVVVYLVMSLPSLFYPFIPAFDKYKIQKNRRTSFAQIMKCLGLVAFTHIIIEPWLYMGLPVYVEWRGIPWTWEELPNNLLFTWTWKMFVALVIEDTYHYWCHRAMHHKSVYWIHKVHHQFYSPFGMTAEYAHPLETLILGMGFFLAVHALCDHVIWLFLWLLVRMLETMDVHSGYDFPFNPLHLIPFYGGAKAHDLHHKCSLGNYSSTFTWWDDMFGTTISDDPAKQPKNPDLIENNKKTE